MPKKEPDYDEVEPTPQEEINQVISAAHALEIDAPITNYSIVGNRIELWTVHGGPYVYDPKPVPTRKPAARPAKDDEATPKPARRSRKRSEGSPKKSEDRPKKES